jgi:hypothetical protein
MATLTRHEFCAKMNNWFMNECSTCIRFIPHTYSNSIVLVVKDQFMIPEQSRFLSTEGAESIKNKVIELTGVEPMFNNTQNIMILWDSRERDNSKNYFND